MEWNREIMQKPMWKEEISNREEKEKIARRMAEKVQDGEVVGFGSGSTSYLTAIEIANKIQKENITITAIPTSYEIKMLCTYLNIPTATIDEKKPDWCFDGADEVDNDKWLIKGTTTLLLVAIVIACYVLINWGVSKIKVENIDCTPKKLYSLSDETKEKIKNLDKDVTIQLINMSGSNYVIEYANKYPTITKKINVEEISDLSSRTDLQTKYSIESTDSLIVVKSGEKEKTISKSSCNFEKRGV